MKESNAGCIKSGNVSPELAKKIYEANKYPVPNEQLNKLYEEIVMKSKNTQEQSKVKTLPNKK